jgi:hypothetical protein
MSAHAQELVARELLAQELLAQAELPVAGLYRRHAEHNLAAISAAIAGSYRDSGPVKLGPSRSLVVIAVDGLGYAHAASALESAVLSPLTSEFPTTTVACLMTSVTGEPAHAHGFIGVQYLHADGRRLINCHDGQITDPAGQESLGTEPARPTRTPSLATVFDVLGAAGVPVVALPNELAMLDAPVLGRLLQGAQIAGQARPAGADLLGRARAFADQVTIAAAARPGTVIWAYLDLDSYIHRHGFDPQAQAAAATLDQLARRLRDSGTSVLVFSDHGLAPNAPSADTLSAWHAVTSERWCRLPPGGAGRIRWIYPHPRHADRLRDRLAGEFAQALVVGPDQLAELGLVAAGSIGQRRLGEIILIAIGADFPAPDASAAYEHGSMTADEVLVPMAIWSAGQ